MLCAISGEAPQVPVASRKSGNVFERRLIEAYIAENGTDPVNGEELSTDDLIELKTARIVRPRPPTLTSIPSLLSTFQNEWDALALETYTLKQQLAQTRQELSTALYQHDAAVRVIARVTRERDEARDALSKITVSAGGPTTNGDAMQVDSQALPESIAAKIDETQQKLSSTRRKRPVPDEWATPETISSFQAEQTSETAFQGARSLAVNSTGELAVIGGEAGVAGIFSIPKNERISSFDFGNGNVVDAVWWQQRAIIALSTGAVVVFEGDAKVADLGSHSGSACGLSLHPCGDILASVGRDRSYLLFDLTSMKLITQVFVETELTSGQFHPDGHLFAAGGVDGQIRLFDVKSSSPAAAFDIGGAVKSLDFSENGTWLAAVVKGDTRAQIWDLRKGSAIKVLDFGNAIQTLKWDYTGQFLAGGGPSGVAIQHYSKASKSWSELLRKAVATEALSWGKDAQSLLVLGTDGTLTVLEAP